MPHLFAPWLNAWEERWGFRAGITLSTLQVWQTLQSGEVTWPAFTCQMMKRKEKTQRCSLLPQLSLLPCTASQTSAIALSVAFPIGQTTIPLFGECSPLNQLILFKKVFYFFIFRERGREGERDGEKHQRVVVSRAPPTGDLAHNPGKCPNWESSQRPFALLSLLSHTSQCSYILIIFKSRIYRIAVNVKSVSLHK